MYYAFIENDLIFITDNEKNIPTNAIRKQVSTNNPEDYFIKDNNIVKITDEQKLEMLKQEALELTNKKLNQLLSDTDWAVVKCIELGLSLEQEYPEIHSARNAYRQDLKDKKEKIEAAKDIEELKLILGLLK